MFCPDHETLVMLADGELSAQQQATVAQHAAGCNSCREFLEEMRELNLAARTSLQAIRVDRPQRIAGVPRERRLLLLRAIAAAAAIIVVGASVVLFRFMTSGDAGVVEVADAPRPVQSPARTSSTPRSVPPLLDEQFERWAAQHRQKRIPRVPLEAVANSHPGNVLPVGPMAEEDEPRS